MVRSTVIVVLLCCASITGAQDWLQWRGPSGEHHAAAGATAPTSWSASDNLTWNTPIPGHGHSSPTIVGDRIYLTAADVGAQTQSLLILDRTSGALLKEVATHNGGLPAEIHPNNTHASPTVASDGERVFTLFYNSASAWLTAYDLLGNQLWQERVAEFDPQMYQFGFGSSPRVVGDQVIVALEYDGKDSGIYALDAATGKQRWATPRTPSISFSTPAVAQLGGTTQLLMSGNNEVAAYDALSGKPLWAINATTRATCGTMIWDDALGLVFASGGYPDRVTVAVRTTGDHEIAWQNSVKCYEQSLLTVRGYVYAVSDRGVAYCWRGTDGEELWKRRLGGNFSSSPLVVGEVIYATNEAGEMFAFEANPERYVSRLKTRLGDTAYATPTPADGRLYHRYVEAGQEYLAAIGP